MRNWGIPPQGKLLQSITTQMAKGRRRLLIQAPSGSGKTLVCVKLVVGLAADELETRSGDAFFGPADVSADNDYDDDGGWAVLLLTHSTALVEQTAEEVVVELESRTGFAVTRGPVGVAGGCPPSTALHCTSRGLPRCRCTS